MPDLKKIESALALSEDDPKSLSLTFATQKIAPGQLVPKGEAQTPPALSFKGATGTYIVIMVDLDAPYASFRILTPALHWIQSGLKAETANDGTTNLVPGNAPFIVDYAAPGPLPLSAPHRYVFLLYEQPAGFDLAKFAPPGGKKVGVWPRVRFDLEAFEGKARLGPIVASSWFSSI